MQLLIKVSNGAAATVDLTERSLSLGRAIDNDLAYPDDPALSRKHLCIEPVASGWNISDCGSRNGTIINDELLTTPRLLRDGDRIYVGHLTIEVKGNGLAAAAPNLNSPRGTTIVTTLDEVLRITASSDEPNVQALSSSRVVNALIHAGQELAGHRPLNELFDVILDLALSAVEARRGIMLTIENDALQVRASRGEGFSLSTAIRSEVLRKKTSLIISDAQYEAAFRDQKSIVAQQIRSVMAVPLQTANRVIGLIYVDNGAILRPFSREDLDLLTVMANVAAIRIEHARLALVEEQERLMQADLDQAADIQRSLLPSEAPPCPSYELAGHNLACRAVGGDYYDFLPYDDGRLGIIVADVCGKGMPAALMMSSLQARMQMLTASNPAPAVAISTLNRNVSGRIPLGRFITVFYGVLDPVSGRLEYTNAGHNYPLLLRADGSTEELRGGGMVVGLFADTPYIAKECHLQPGDLLVLYSDGVTEAAQPSGPQFGEKALAQFFRAHRTESCQNLVHQLVNHVRSWTGCPSFSDDFTVVLVRRS